jgi:hypothetical protein
LAATLAFGARFRTENVELIATLTVALTAVLVLVDDEDAWPSNKEGGGVGAPIASAGIGVALVPFSKENVKLSNSAVAKAGSVTGGPFSTEKATLSASCAIAPVVNPKLTFPASESPSAISVIA